MVMVCWIQEEMAKLSADAAGDRATDVYMGVDVFGRNTFGGGEYNVGYLYSHLYPQNEWNSFIFHWYVYKGAVFQHKVACSVMLRWR